MSVEDLIYTAIKIENYDTANKTSSSGSGFFYTFEINDTKLVCVITNKHVIDEGDVIGLHMPLANEAGERIFGAAKIFTIDQKDYPIFRHPNDNVDLAAIPIGPVWSHLEQQGVRPFNLSLHKSNFAPLSLLPELRAFTNIVMIGYPNGIMDTKNNLPIARKGILATPYRADYNGEKNFVIDIAAFPGSSGSAIFAYFDGIVPSKGGYSLGGEQAYFLGILHSGPIISANGEIREVAPTATLFSQTNLMMHLGFCAKAELINDFEPSITEYLLQHSK